jgi:hypothetical protein
VGSLRAEQQESIRSKRYAVSDLIAAAVVAALNFLSLLVMFASWQLNLGGVLILPQ